MRPKILTMLIGHSSEGVHEQCICKKSRDVAERVVNLFRQFEVLRPMQCARFPPPKSGVEAPLAYISLSLSESANGVDPTMQSFEIVWKRGKKFILPRYLQKLI